MGHHRPDRLGIHLPAPARADASRARCSPSATRSSRSSPSRARRRASSHAAARSSSGASTARRAEIRIGPVHHSFRSGPAMLQCGRSCLPRRGDLSRHPRGRGRIPLHQALPDAAPGRVDLWAISVADEQAGHRGLARAVRRRLGDERRGQAGEAHPRPIRRLVTGGTMTGRRQSPPSTRRRAGAGASARQRCSMPSSRR